MMRNAKLWSVLLAAVLLCACMAGVLFTTAGAADTRIPTATATYVVGTDGDSIRACLAKAAAQTWAKDSVLEIQFSGEDSSAFSKPDAENGVSGYTLFETATIFREDDTQLPIVIRGTDEDRAAIIMTSSNSYNATNDYFFTNLTMNGGAGAKSSVSFYAGSGELVFENTNHNNYNYTYYYGDCQTTDAFRGWDAAKVAANSNEKGLLETGIVFGNGVTGLYEEFSDDAPDENQRLSAVGLSYEASNPVISALTRKSDSVTEALTQDEVNAVKEAAKEATFRPGNLVPVDECVVKPWNTSAYLILDSGNANPTQYEFGYCGARKGVSPVREARIELISGGVQYISADSHKASVNETYVGDTKVIMRGGKILSNSVGIRLTNYAMMVGDLTLEIHEDDPAVPTFTKFVQASQSSTTSTVFGDYYFLMTGGTIGNGYSLAKMSGGEQVLGGTDGKTKQWNYTDSNDGYWGAPTATGTIVNEVRGGQIWRFNGSRFGHTYENTPISTVLPGTGEILTAQVAVHNIISGGIIGGPKVQGTTTNSSGTVVDVQNGTKAFYGGVRDSSSATIAIGSVCNEISGGTIYKWNANSSDKAQRVLDVYNIISGAKENGTTFLCDFYGTNLSGVASNNIYNIIKGYPKFHDGTTKRWIIGGTKSGTIGSVTNYVGGLPEFNDFFGGSTGSSAASTSNAAVKTLVNHFAFDDTETAIPGQIWGGNGEWDPTKGSVNSSNFISVKLESHVYSGTYGTFRAESTSGTDKVGMELNIYGGTFTSSLIPANRTYSKSNTSIKNTTVTTNIYGGTFKGNAYMGGQNARNQHIVNNIYGGTFNASYYGGGDDWARTVTNNVYGGTFNSYYYGGGYKCGSEAITNNIYGGAFKVSDADYHDYMGAYGIPEDEINQVAGSITNNFYGGDFGSGWTYGGHRNGPATTITNTFHSGADNPVRDPENALYKYFDAEGTTTQEGGTRFRDQVVCGSGYTEAYVDKNTVESITNTFKGGCWTKETGAGNVITIHGGMRWGTVGSVTNNFIEGAYYRFFGGCDYGRVNGTITNNFGKTLAEGEEAPQLSFSNYVYGAGLDDVNLGTKISAALAVEEASRTDTEAAWVNFAAANGEDCQAGAEFVINNVNYGTYHQFLGGSYQNAESGNQSVFDTITNNINGGTFDKRGNDATVYAGGCLRNVIFKTGIVNNINGGTFNGNWYGGTVGNGTVVCPSITNTFNGGEGYAAENAFVYFGNGGPEYNGTVKTVVNDFTANKSYVYAGSYGPHNQPAGAECAIDTTINGGTFIGFWGQGGTDQSVLTGNVRTTVNGGTFNSWSENMRNAIAGGTRNGATNGNIELIINDGTFAGDVVGGTIYGSYSAATKEINGNITVTVKGGDFQEDIYGICKTEGEITCTGDVAINVEQTAGVALKLGGEAEIDSFISNGETVRIDAETNIAVGTLVGTLNLKQTEGWLAHDYLKLPAGSAYTIDTTEAKYGRAIEDETILVKGFGIEVSGATIRLEENLGLRFLFDPDDTDSYGDAFTVKVLLDGETLATGTREDLEMYHGYRSFVVKGIGLPDFATAITVGGSAIVEKELSLMGLVQQAKASFTGEWLEVLGAIENLHKVYNLGETSATVPEAVTQVNTKTDGAAVEKVTSASVSLAMGDAVAIKAEVVLAEIPENFVLKVNGVAVEDYYTVTPGEGVATVSITLPVKARFMEDMIAVELSSDSGVYFTYEFSIAATAYELANDTENADAAKAAALLYYIQQAVDCVA